MNVAQLQLTNLDALDATFKQNGQVAAFRKELQSFDEKLVDSKEMKRDSTAARLSVRTAAVNRFNAWRSKSETVKGIEAGREVAFPPLFLRSVEEEDEEEVAQGSSTLSR